MKSFVFTLIIVWPLLFPKNLMGFPEDKLELAADPTIDLLVGNNLKEILISGVDLQREIFANTGISNVIKNGNEKKNNREIRFRCNYNYKQREKLLTQVLAKVTSPTGVLNFSKEKYKGDFLILGPNKQGHCDLVNQVSLEKYVSVVLPKEMNARWPIEALKAQAVAGRSYALYLMLARRGLLKQGKSVLFDLENSEKHQVSGTLFDETAKTSLSAKSTAGEVLVAEDGQKMQQIFFHARCGGKTSLPEDVWGNRVPGYQSVLCPACYNSENIDWSVIISREEIWAFIRDNHKKWKKGGETLSQRMKLSLYPSEIDANDVGFVLQDKKTFATEIVYFKKAAFRRYFGREKIVSNRFVVKAQDGLSSFKLEGKGNGHGVGMCQMGALELAKRGWDYVKILQYYFPQYKIAKNYGGMTL
ncbi:MAG: SpoIID/LytB domain-containing protein [Oligoflexia bacterium]|nr:SpoIID/LytB domain-containing protein [Oligoflexia bacterium]MBF0366092.1 SpoIID/LytB domain-containing protein [Oligoflexia bacterium]